MSALLSFSTLILERKSAGRYWDWLKQSPFSLVLPAGFLWLFVLGVVHGFTGDQMDGLVSGCFALIMMITLSSPGFPPVRTGSILVLVQWPPHIKDRSIGFGSRGH